jgi:cell volume regulation protein A
VQGAAMASIDSVSITILFGAVLVLAGIMSSLIALRFGAPLLLVFLLVGLLAGESGIGGIKFDDVQLAYTVGSVALGLILFDGGLRTKIATFRNVLAPAGLLATLGVLITAALTAPVALWMLGTTWTESLLVGAVMASTDAAAVFFLLHAKGLRLRPRVSATLEVESGVNDPFAIFLTIVLVEILFSGQKSWNEIASLLIEKALLGALIGWLGGRAMVLVLNRLELPQGMHAPFVATGALVVFGLAEAIHGSGFLAVYIAGLVVGNRETRAHGTIVTFLDAATWLAQIAMFVLLGLLAWPERLPQRLLPALMVALALMLIARPAAVLLCLAPFRFSMREKLFISWVGLRGAVSVFLAAIPMLVGLPGAHFYFDVAFVVVMLSLAIQGWTIGEAARLLRIGLPRIDVNARRTELDLPGTLKQELVGYPLVADSPYLRRGISPSWAKLTLVVRDDRVHTPEEAATVREGDHVYFLAPPDRVQALDRFFADQPPQALADANLVEDFFVPGEITLGALAEIYGLEIAPEDAQTPLADYFTLYFIKHPPRPNDAIPLGPVKLVAHTVTNDRVVMVGLQLADPEPVPRTLVDKIRVRGRRVLRRTWSWLKSRVRRP